MQPASRVAFSALPRCYPSLTHTILPIPRIKAKMNRYVMLVAAVVAVVKTIKLWREDWNCRTTMMFYCSRTAFKSAHSQCVLSSRQNISTYCTDDCENLKNFTCGSFHFVVDVTESRMAATMMAVFISLRLIVGQSWWFDESLKRMVLPISRRKRLNHIRFIRLDRSVEG